MINLLNIYTDLPVLARKWVNILAFFLLAWLLSRLAGILSRRIIRLGALASHRSRPERQKTLYGLVQSIITVSFFVVAVLLSLSQFVETTTLVWMIGLFGAGFGFQDHPNVDIVAVSDLFPERRQGFMKACDAESPTNPWRSWLKTPPSRRCSWQRMHRVMRGTV